MVYRRTRRENGASVVRAELRFDLAGCLRTPAGGSSRQIVLCLERNAQNPDGVRIRSRLLSPRESGRLMGLPDGYVLPRRANDAYHLTGDGVVVPVIAHLEQHLLHPLMQIAARREARV